LSPRHLPKACAAAPAPLQGTSALPNAGMFQCDQ
jgi:hypothetical protein